MYSSINDSLNAAFKKSEREIQDKIKHLQDELAEKQEKFNKLQNYCNSADGDMAKFNKLIEEYGFTASDYMMYDLKMNRCAFCISNDGGKFKVPVAICKNKKKNGKLYLTFETKLNETLVNVKTENEYSMMRNAMYARPRIHVFLHSEQELKDTFFMLARELKEVKTKRSSEHFTNYTCHVAKENIKNIKMLEELN